MEIHQFDSGYALGDTTLLEQDPLAVYCSRDVRAEVVVPLERMVKSLAAQGVVLAGGWHSPLEKRLFRRALSQENGRVVYCRAKGITQFTPPENYHTLMKSGRLLVYSPFLTESRITREEVEIRDRWLFRRVSRYLFGALDPGGGLVDRLRRCKDANKEVFVLDHPANAHCIDESVIALNRENRRAVSGTVPEDGTGSR